MKCPTCGHATAGLRADLDGTRWCQKCGTLTGLNGEHDVLVPDLARSWDDEPLPEDKEIEAAHPTRSGKHERFAYAMRMVSAKHSKFALIGLVNWLLARIEEANERRGF
jgi:hypothetical protein